MCRILFLVAILIGVGCEVPLGEQPHQHVIDVATRTDKASYQSILRSDGFHRVEITIPFSIENTGTVPLYQVGCITPPQPLLERREGDEWQLAFSGVERACLSPPFIIEPGTTRQDTFKVEGALPGQNFFPTFTLPAAGEYRLNFEFYSSLTDEMHPHGEDLLPEGLRVSNVFRVEDP